MVFFFIFFLRKRPLHFLSSLLCYLLIQENVQTNIKGKTLRSSRSQMFFKIAVLKNFAVLSRDNLCWSLFLVKLQAWRPVFLLKKRIQHRRPAKIAELSQNTSCSLYFSEFLYDERILWTSLGKKLTFSLFPYLFSYQIFNKCAFVCIATSAPALFWLNR